MKTIRPIRMISSTTMRVRATTKAVITIIITITRSTVWAVTVNMVGVDVLTTIDMMIHLTMAIMVATIIQTIWIAILTILVRVEEVISRMIR